MHLLFLREQRVKFAKRILSRIQEDDMEQVQHEIPPLYDGHSKILILGSFPSVKSREGHFFYNHPQNRFWRVLAAVTGQETPVSHS